MDLEDRISRLKIELASERATACTEIDQAWQMARHAHVERTHWTGVSLLAHAIETAETLAEWRLGCDMVIAALLHDTLDVDRTVNILSNQELERVVSPTVMQILDGLSSIGYMKEAWTELGARAAASRGLIQYQDVRPVIIKLASALLATKHVSLMPDLYRRQSRMRDLRATYTSVARRLGLHRVYQEIEVVYLRTVFQEESQRIESWADRLYRESLPLLEEIRSRLDTQLKSAGIEADVEIAQRSLVGQFNRVLKARAIIDVDDTIVKESLRLPHVAKVIVRTDSAADCYRVLGMLHGLGVPVQASFRDYIAEPKDSGYSALHTAVTLETKGRVVTIDARIKTRRMETLSVRGITDERAFAAWQRWREGEALVDLVEELRDGDGERGAIRQLLRSLSTGGPNPDQIQAFTPEGRAVQLLRGATPLDFAYAIHSELGHQYAGAKVNGLIVEMAHQLQNGDLVEIQTSRAVEPSPNWLSAVATHSARRHIQIRLKRAPRVVGEHLLRESLAVRNAVFEAPDIQNALKEVMRRRFRTAGTLLEAIGTGQITADEVATAILARAPSDEEVRPPIALTRRQIEQLTAEGRVLPKTFKYAQCCHPEKEHGPIIGCRRGHIVRVHRSSCNRGRSGANQIEVMWRVQQTAIFQVRIDAHDRIGLARDVADKVADQAIYMSDFHAQAVSPGEASIRMDLLVRSTDVLELLHTTLQEIPGVRHVHFANATKQGVLGSSGTRRVGFIGVPNPFSPGMPILEAGRFYGRNREVSRALSYLSSGSLRGAGILVYGQRRIGKTSLVRRIQKHVRIGSRYVAAYTSLEGLSEGTDRQFLDSIWRAICLQLQDEGFRIETHTLDWDDTNCYERWDEAVHRVVAQLNGRSILILLDEFEAALLAWQARTLSERFFRELRRWAQSESIALTLVGGLQLRRDLEGTWADLYRTLTPIHVGPLDGAETRQLLTNAIEPYMKPQINVVDSLVRWTSGYPYYVHMLGAKLFSEVEAEKRQEIKAEDLQRGLDWMTGSPPSSGFYRHFRDGLDKAQRQILAAMADLSTETSGRWVRLHLIAERMPEGDSVSGRTIQQALDDLCQQEVIVADAGSGRDRGYRVALPLFEAWIRQHWSQ